MITKEQYRLLKSIMKHNGTLAKDYDRRKGLYDYFRAERYIRHGDVNGYYGYVITEKGKIELKLYREERYRFWIPTVISIIALLVSIISEIMP